LPTRRSSDLVYPKAVQKKKGASSPEKQEAAPKTASVDKENEVYQKLERQKVASNEVEWKAFEEQSQKEAITVAQAPSAASPTEGARPEPTRNQAKASLGAGAGPPAAPRAAPAPGGAPALEGAPAPAPKADLPVRKEELDLDFSDRN